MYKKFFGFKEKPFKLVPNPEYLFLSKSHEEALGHLTYAILHGDGFVEITGEVGTGKTTLCRVFLEGLDKSIEAAYIFNPKLDAMQLLKAINDEFGIDSKPDNTKDLIDMLNGFLIEKKAAGQKVLVLIDEAQNLSLEVLEQLRLLSNLETTQEKLLQIILVGQPELGDMLSSHQLRQLGQRITINCQLAPLTFQESMDYIRHRISLASHRAGPPFDNSSYRAIYEYSQGIPRLINIACDRILLNAFSRNSFKITGSITKEAIKELTRKKSGSSYGWFQRTPRLVIISAVFTSLAIILLHLFNSQPFETQVSREDQISAQVANDLHQEALPEIKKVHEPKEPVVSQSSEPPVLQSEASLSVQPPEVPKTDNSKETASLAEVLELSDHSPEGLSQPPGLPKSDDADADNIPAVINIHTVHAGTFQSASLATELVEELKALGYPSFMYIKTSEEKTEYIVVAGKYQSYNLAKKASLKLNNNGYNNFIAKAKDSLNRGPAILINQQPVGSDAGKEDAN
jgi:general secretion pathway protein A